ncbi:MAG: hypothetical protein HY735_04485 [Verrucomicrobia bacterium]|nr:hypothetical protein [Verrucomicrobiota bacterium]
MKPDPSKLRQKAQEEQAAAFEQTHPKRAALQFASAEEAIRYDAGETAVPPQIAQRLNESIAREPKPAVSWWRRWFSRDTRE